MATNSRRARTPSTAIQPELSDDLARALQRLFFAFRKWNYRNWSKSESGGSVLRFYLLERLATSDEPWRMSDLAENLGVSGRMMTSLVDGLESEGLVRRRVHPSDRRAMLVELTATLEEARGPLRTYHHEVGALFAGLSKEDQEAFLRVSSQLVESARAQEAEAVAEARAAGS